jgi:branched-chain amino acid transport system substrate-binding protein
VTAVLKALKKASFKSVRGDFSTVPTTSRCRTTICARSARTPRPLTNKLVGTTLEKHQDAYVGACK